ncbi:MAG: SRPBCC family protein [Pseudomonadota bacterium]
MQFTTKEDLETPIEYAFGQITDFDSFERIALRRGAEIVRIDTRDRPGPTMRWRGRANFRGRVRSFDARVEKMERPTKLRISAKTDGFDLRLEIDLEQLSPPRTRMKVALELRPKTLSARLILQSARLAKSSLTRRYKRKVADYAKQLESRFRRA